MERGFIEEQLRLAFKDLCMLCKDCKNIPIEKEDKNKSKWIFEINSGKCNLENCNHYKLVDKRFNDVIFNCFESYKRKTNKNI